MPTGSVLSTRTFRPSRVSKGVIRSVWRFMLWTRSPTSCYPQHELGKFGRSIRAITLRKSVRVRLHLRAMKREIFGSLAERAVVADCLERGEIVALTALVRIIDIRTGRALRFPELSQRRQWRQDLDIRSVDQR